MKKLLLIALAAIPCLVEAYCPSCQSGVTYQGNGYIMRKRTVERPGPQIAGAERVAGAPEQVAAAPESYGEEVAGSVDCGAACSAGVMSRAVAQQCNNCEGWTDDDKVVQEYRDYPS